MNRSASRRGTAELSGFTPLHYAAARKDRDGVQKAIASGSDINQRDIYGETVLHLACRSGDLEIVKLLIAQQANLNMVSDAFLTPLHQACLGGYPNLIQLLLDAGAEVDIQNDKGQKAVELCRNDESYQVFVKGGLADVAQHPSKVARSYSPLMYAASMGDVLTVQRLLSDSSTDLNLQCGQGDTALHLACRSGSFPIARLLIDHKADVNIENNHKETPIDVANRSSHTEVAMKLLECYPKISFKYTVVK